MASPGSRLVPQRKPGEKAISAPCTSISASQISWSQLPLKLPRRYSRPSVTASFSASLASYGARTFVISASISGSALSMLAEDRQQPVAVVGDLAALDLEVHHAEELAVAAGVGHQRACRRRWPPAPPPARRRACGRRRSRRCRARGWPSSGRRPCRCATARTTTCAPLPRASSTIFCMFVVLDAEAPVGDHVARVGDRRVREGLADDRHRHAVDLADHVGLEHRVAEIGGLDVLRDEVDLALEVLARRSP